MMGRSPDLAQNPIVKVYCSQMVGRSDWICPRKRLKQVGGPFGGPRGPSGGPRGALRALWGPLGGPRGMLRGPPGGSWGATGGLRGALGGPPGPPGDGCGTLGGPPPPPPPQGQVVRAGGAGKTMGMVGWAGIVTDKGHIRKVA
jgi:hypothetical protein